MKENSIDAVTRLAINIQANKGVYIPLLGSGVCLPAGILSGWKVTEDLLKKLSFVQEGHIANDVFNWYESKYHKEAQYSDLLSELGYKNTEIGNLLWSYFEPTEEERNNHLKEPTDAHTAIAELASKGYFKVILTTNFDRLIETALERKGVKYQVISNESQLDTAVPIIHFPLTVVKVNGDYKETSVRNTVEELTNYPERWNVFLKRIFKDFGLISCGWSAKWDIALIKDIKESTGHQYSYNFTFVGEDESNRFNTLAKECEGVGFKIDNADNFFKELADKVNALEIIKSKDMEIDRQIAITRVKEYIMKDEDLIRYTDLFEDETKRAIERISEVTYTHETMTAQLYSQIYENAYTQVAVLLDMGIVASRWANDDVHQEVVVNSLYSMANRPLNKIGDNIQEQSFKQNHAIDTVFLYGMGVSCVFYRNFSLLDRLLRVKLDDSDLLFSDYLVDIANCWIIDKEDWNRTVGYDRKKTPFSWFVSNLIRSSFSFIKDKEYEVCFCIFEKILAMYYYMLISSKIDILKDTAPIGQFAWLSPYYSRDKLNKYNLFFDEIEKLKDDSPQIKGGLFEKSYKKYEEILKNINQIEQRAGVYLL